MTGRPGTPKNRITIVSVFLRDCMGRGKLSMTKEMKSRMLEGKSGRNTEGMHMRQTEMSEQNIMNIEDNKHKFHLIVETTVLLLDRKAGTKDTQIQVGEKGIEMIGEIGIEMIGEKGIEMI
jgi:hypothetical protein